MASNADDANENVPVVASHVPPTGPRTESEDVVFEPEPAEASVTYPGSPQTAASDVASKHEALAMSAEMRELLGKRLIIVQGQE